MSADPNGRIARAARRTRAVLGLRTAVLLTAGLALPPFTLWSFDHEEDWHWSAFTRAVQGGYIREDWAGYLFQQDSFPGYVRSVGQWFANPFSYLLVTLAFFALGAWLLERLAALVADLPPARKGHGDSVLAQAFTGGRLSELGEADGEPVEVGLHRGFVLLSVPAGGRVPPVVLEAASAARHRRVRALHLSHADAAVMEGEFLERWRIHAPSSLLRAVPRLLTPAVLQDLAAIETATYLESAGDRLFALYPSRALRRAGDVETEVRRLRKAGRSLAGATSDAPDVARSYDLDARVGAWRTRSLQVGRLVLSGWWSLVLLAGLVVGDFIEEAISKGGVNENVMLLHVTLIGWLLMLRLRAPGLRRIRPRGEPAQ